ncbi:MAG: aminotransferase class V-fold PLP-dependent enzyme, partial [Alistipes sp.]|nr:aminotransferase class V-fold PLP-dependent enzyme [Alistipes sp.]
IEGLRIYGTTEDKSPIISFNVEGCDHYDIGMILDKMGIAVRTGHHCAEPVMARYGTNGVVRASIALYTNKEDIEMFIKAVKRAVSMLK